MEDRTNVAAAPVPLKFADGSEFLCSPLTDRDCGTLDEWCRATFLERARKGIDELPERAAIRAERLAQETVATMSWMHGVGSRMIATPDGLAFMIWLQIRHNQPEVKLSDLREKMLDPVNQRFANQAFVRVQRIEEDSKKS